jgi:hypothetical protein
MGDASLSGAQKHALETVSIVTLLCRATEVKSHKLSDGTSKTVLLAQGRINTGAGRGFQIALMLSDPKCFVFWNDLRHPEQKQRVDLPADIDPYAVAFNPSGTMLAAITQSGFTSGLLPTCDSHVVGKLHFFAPLTSTHIWEYSRVIQAYTECSSEICSVQFDATGRRVVTAMDGNNSSSSFKVFDVQTGLFRDS